LDDVVDVGLVNVEVIVVGNGGAAYAEKDEGVGLAENDVVAAAYAEEDGYYYGEGKGNAFEHAAACIVVGTAFVAFAVVVVGFVVVVAESVVDVKVVAVVELVVVVEVVAVVAALKLG